MRGESKKKKKRKDDENKMDKKMKENAAEWRGC